MYFVRKILYKYLRILNQIIPLRYKILFSVMVVVSVFVLIYELYIANSVATIAGLSLILLGVFLILQNKSADKIQKKIIARKIKIYTSNRSQKSHGIMVDTKGGNYNETVEGNYIEGDFVNHNITIQGHKVGISSDISDTLNEFREILAQTIVQNPNPVESISNFAEELVAELQKNPEVKSYFNVDKDINDKELVNTIIKLVLTQNYNFKNSYSQILNNDNELDSVDYLENEEEEEESYRYISSYRGYKIDLAKINMGIGVIKLKKVMIHQRYITPIV